MFSPTVLFLSWVSWWNWFALNAARHCLLDSTWVARACVEAKSLDFWEQRAIPIGLRRNPGPLPYRILPPQASPFFLGLKQGVGEAEALLHQRSFQTCLDASGEIQALVSLLSLAIGCFLDVLHVLFDFSLCPLLACAKVPCHYPAPAPPTSSFQGCTQCSCSFSLCLDVLLCVTQWVSLFLVCFFF